MIDKKTTTKQTKLDGMRALRKIQIREVLDTT